MPLHVLIQLIKDTTQGQNYYKQLNELLLELYTTPLEFNKVIQAAIENANVEFVPFLNKVADLEQNPNLNKEIHFLPTFDCIEEVSNIPLKIPRCLKDVVFLLQTPKKFMHSILFQLLGLIYIPNLLISCSEYEHFLYFKDIVASVLQMKQSIFINDEFQTYQFQVLRALFDFDPKAFILSDYTQNEILYLKTISQQIQHCADPQILFKVYIHQFENIKHEGKYIVAQMFLQQLLKHGQVPSEAFHTKILNGQEKQCQPLTQLMNFWFDFQKIDQKQKEKQLK
ncbi:Hypothetical_protein [Hexamita inflata]|uniref:Hypothetical_protein n=1 Tax=Hexamita inflata TaxID=28002 RepID=A0AA86QJJ3_9EUKA|nr:Hypothetical protein HINF_LOCUS47113 [Hexamita inflata]